MFPYVYTKDMQTMHNSVYKKFFARYDLVLSLPHIFRFGHAIGKGSSALSMRQKLPHMIYVGVNRADHGECRFDHMTSFDIVKGQFSSGAPYEYIRNIESIEQAGNRILTQTEEAYGLDIGILTEYPKWYGVSFNTVLCTLLAVVLFIQEKKIPLEVITTYNFQHTHLFTDIGLLGCYIKYLATGSAGSFLPFVALQQQNHSLFQIWKVSFSGFSNDQLQQRVRQLSRLFDLDLSRAEPKPLWWYPLVRDRGWMQGGLPIDVAILHIGTSYESLREKENALLASSSEELLWWFAQVMQQQGIALSPEPSLLPLPEVYGHMSTVLYTRLFHSCLMALQPDREDLGVRELLAVLKDMGFYHCLFEHQYETITLLSHAFSSQKRFPEETCAFLPLTTVKTWGTFLAVIPRHGARQTIETMVTHLTTQHHLPVHVLYSSRKEDTDHHGGVQLHQYISESIFSPYITQGTVQLLLGDGTKKMGEYDAIHADPLVQSGIAFDMIKRKVLINGKKVNHKVLCSQSATIEIMVHLLEHIGEFLPNRTLPASAYSKNKNEMISKILIPLQEIVTSLGDQLDVVCTGTMYDRTICLKKKPTCVHLIQYVHP